WSNGATGQCITVPGPAAGTSAVYTVTVADKYSAKASASDSLYGQRCQLDLARSASVTDVCSGLGVPVTYSYQVTNSGDWFAASGTLVYDNGTPSDSSDNVTVGSWGPLAPGASQALTRTATLNLTAPFTNMAMAAGTSGNAAVSKTASTTVTPHACGYNLVKS